MIVTRDVPLTFVVDEVVFDPSLMYVVSSTPSMTSEVALFTTVILRLTGLVVLLQNSFSSSHLT